MNDRSTKPRQAAAVKEKGQPQSGEYPRTSNVDDEFHEFFNQGDVGEYEGGVAYTQPPTRLLPETEEQIVVTDPSRQKARRAFFGRVVAIIVAACVVLLVTAARFGPQDVRKDADNGARHAAVQYAESQGLKLPSPPQANALPLGPAVATAAVPQAPAAAAPPPPSPEVEQVAPDTIENDPAGVKSAVEAPKNSDLPTAAAHPQPKQVPVTLDPAAKVNSGLGSPIRLIKKSKSIATREAPPSTPGVSKPVKESVGAFPVD